MNVAALLQDAPSGQRAAQLEPGEVVAAPEAPREPPREPREMREMGHREPPREPRDMRERTRSRASSTGYREPAFRDTLPPPPPRRDRGWDREREMRQREWEREQRERERERARERDGSERSREREAARAEFGLGRGEPLTERDRLRPKGWTPQPTWFPPPQLKSGTLTPNPPTPSPQRAFNSFVDRPPPPPPPPPPALTPAPALAPANRPVSPPPPAPAVKPRARRDLGTYIYPQVPFPYSFPPSKPADTVVTLVIPAAFIPKTDWIRGLAGQSGPKPRLWGGGLPAGRTVLGQRRIYTDDSDPFLAAVHTGLIAPASQDLSLTLRIIHVASTSSAPGDEVVGRFLAGPGHGDYGSQIHSCAWGANHDGSAFEVLDAHYINSPVQGARRALTKRRLTEYVQNSPQDAVTISVKWGHGGIHVL